MGAGPVFLSRPLILSSLAREPFDRIALVSLVATATAATVIPLPLPLPPPLLYIDRPTPSIPPRPIPGGSPSCVTILQPSSLQSLQPKCNPIQQADSGEGEHGNLYSRFTARKRIEHKPTQLPSNIYLGCVRDSSVVCVCVRKRSKVAGIVSEIQGSLSL